MKLSIGALGNTIFEVSLSRNLNDTENIEIRLQQQQNNGPQDTGAGGAAAAPHHAPATDQPAPHNEPQPLPQGNMAVQLTTSR